MTSLSRRRPTPFPAGAIRYTVSATGNTARYRVREQLMGKDLPNDAIGETSEIEGMITVDSTTGSLIAGQSKFVIRTGAFKSAAQQAPGRATGSASTKFTFADFTITLPKAPILLSVADTIALEYDFTMLRKKP
ncbi:MAG: hypothetical protein ABIT20_21420 [Gemmatimonadaceae bacterium]